MYSWVFLGDTKVEVPFGPIYKKRTNKNKYCNV